MRGHLHNHRIDRYLFCLASVINLVACSLASTPMAPQVGKPAIVMHLKPTSAPGNEPPLGSLISTIALSPDGNFLAVGGSMGLSLVRTTTLDELWFSTMDPPRYASSAAFSSDGEMLVTNGTPAAQEQGNNALFVWNVTDGELRYSIEGFKYFVTSLAFQPNGHLLAIGFYGGAVTIWDTDSNKLQSILNDQSPITEMSRQETKVAWSSDGTKLAAGGWYRSALIWDVASGNLLRSINANSPIDSVAWSPDGSLLATSADTTVTLWDIDTGHQVVALRGQPSNGQVVPGGSILALSWSPDGKMIALGTEDGRILVWNTKDHSLEYTLKKHTGGVHSLIWTSDSTVLFSASYDKTVIVWNMECGEPMDCLGCES